MGSSSRHITAIAAVAAARRTRADRLRGGDDDDAASAVEAPGRPPTELGDGVDADGLTDDARRRRRRGRRAGRRPARPSTSPTMQVPGQAIAIEARATLQADDVRAAVDRHHVDGHDARRPRRRRRHRLRPAATTTATSIGSRATLVLEVPPAELPAVADALEELGTVLSFDQLAEDVTDQLADLDTRIANLRASVERVRALYAEAVDIDSIVRLEAELTRRETDLEMLLASQQALEDRVTMSTLTVDVTATPAALDADDDRPGIVDAAAAGWGAFVGGLFAIVLVLAAIAPFVIAALVLAVLALVGCVSSVRRRPRRRPDAGASARRAAEPESASRPG